MLENLHFYLIIFLHFYININNEELEKLIKDNMELKKVGKKIVEISRDEELQGWYDEEEHQRRVRNSMMASAIKEGWNEGKAQGIKEGKNSRH